MAKRKTKAKVEVEKIDVVDPIVVEVIEPSDDDKIRFSLSKIQDSLNSKPNQDDRRELLRRQTILQGELKDLQK